MSAQAIKKRNYRVVQREKRRRAFFIHDYIRIKYPELFNEANGMYLQFSDKYPGKADLTKTYYFKKWKAEMEKSQNVLMIPHLPILMSADLLQQPVPKQQVQSPEVQPPEVQPPEVQPPKVQPPEVQPPDVQSPEVQPPEVQPPEVQPPEVQSPEVQPPEVQQTVEVQTTDPDDLTAGMTLNEMSLVVDQLVNALQSDRELMDIVEGFDLPDAVWDNELSIPDYILESELEW